jgi:hypothetical protein
MSDYGGAGIQVFRFSGFRGLRYWVLAVGCLLVSLAPMAAGAQLPATLPPGIGADEQAVLRSQMADMDARLETLGRRGGRVSGSIADAALFPKAVVWALRYAPAIRPEDLALIRRAVLHGRQRTEALEAGKQPWETKRGRLVRGYVSQVDGSVQPYGLIVPVNYDPNKPMRLDVVLHGSVRPDGMAALHFLSPFDEGDSGGTAGGADFIELHPMGRVENCYRWAGEADVFEAIEDVCRKYRIDRDRIVLRGMSMGASGTWHLGLKHPDFFVALGPYCGYVDTHRFSETPGMNFVKVGPLPDVQEKMLHMLDSVDYAANAGIVPVTAAIGDKDPFFQAHVIMGEAFRRERVEFVNLIAPNTAHVQDPANFARQMNLIRGHADKGLDHARRQIRFVTWTLKYSRCHWLQLLALKRHYERAEILVAAADSGNVSTDEPRNILRFAIYPPMLRKAGSQLTVGGVLVPLPRERSEAGLIIERRRGWWVFGGYTDKVKLAGKRPGLQGPIDDAFTSRFLCVRGTGKAWNPATQAWVDANLRRFAYEWSRYFLGDLPVKDDTAVTAEDCRRCNLILFGDPGSNSWIRKALPSLPFRWSRDAIEIGVNRYAASDIVPACIAPSPFTGKGGTARYIVLNSGHTFHESELGRLNYLLFPRLGDWAVFAVKEAQPTDPSAPLEEQMLETGLWDERWR